MILRGDKLPACRLVSPRDLSTSWQLVATVLIMFASDLQPEQAMRTRLSRNRLRRCFRVGIDLLALLLPAVLAGCVSDQQHVVKRNLMADKLAAERIAGVAEEYQVGCPDVLEIAVAARKEFNGNYLVEPDGRINLGRYGRLRVQDRRLADIGRQLAEEIGVRPPDVRVRVVEYRSQQLVLVGQVIGRQRTVPYQGQETVLDLLQRAGGITPGAASQDVYVIRAHLGDGPPEIFHVDLDAIVVRKDDATNIRLMPSDHIFVGETRQARIEKCIPPWLRPLYQKIWDMLPVDQQPREYENVLSRWISGLFGTEVADAKTE
jgi:polysaccharide biosynthesis/export protein